MNRNLCSISKSAICEVYCMLFLLLLIKDLKNAIYLDCFIYLLEKISAIISNLLRCKQSRLLSDLKIFTRSQPKDVVCKTITWLSIFFPSCFSDLATQKYIFTLNFGCDMWKFLQISKWRIKNHRRKIDWKYRTRRKSSNR